MNRMVQMGLNLLRTAAGPDSALERFLRRQYRTTRTLLARKCTGENFVIFWSGRNRGNRIGIYMKGGCDVLRLFACQPLVHHVLDGTCCILREGSVSDSRSDLLLQSLQYLPPEWIDPVIEKLTLPADYFRSQLFDKTVVVQGPHGAEESPKKLVILSIGSDAVRTVYRHRQHGFLVDPGGWWLNQPLNTVLRDLSAATWFRQNFVSIGKISVEAFAENFTHIIQLVKEKTGAQILVLNTLAVEPGSQVHNYQFVNNSPSKRHREFNLALVELSRRHAFSILDTDRILKRAGIQTLVDFAHLPPERYEPIAREAFGIMRQMGIF